MRVEDSSSSEKFGFGGDHQSAERLKLFSREYVNGNRNTKLSFRGI
jgi:hypothetical protein